MPLAKFCEDSLAAIADHLRSEHRLKLNVDYCFMFKYNKLTILCDEVWVRDLQEHFGAALGDRLTIITTEGKHKELLPHQKMEKTARALGKLIDPDKNTVNQLYDPALWEESAKRWTEKLKDQSLNQIWIRGLADMCSTVAMKLRQNHSFLVADFVVTEQNAIHKRAFGR